jgi:secreted trypsin-like serine protease
MVAMVSRTSKKGLSFCGSSLVSAMTVVTAAHCVEKFQPKAIKVIIFFPNIFLENFN